MKDLFTILECQENRDPKNVAKGVVPCPRQQVTFDSAQDGLKGSVQHAADTQQPSIFRVTTTLLALAFLLSGCFDFEANHMVAKFKVLAVQAEPPEIAPGEGFEMEVLYADPQGNGREVSFAWFMCINGLSPAAPLRPEMGLGACIPAQPPVVETAMNDGHIFLAATTPDDIMSLYPQELLNQPGGVPVDAQIVYVTAVVVGCAGGQLPGPAGLATIPAVDNPADLCQGGDGWATHKVLRVTPAENPTPNENPVISQIRVGEQVVPLAGVTGAPSAEPLTFHCESTDKCDFKFDVEVDLFPESQQRYHTKSADGYEQTAEVLYVTWYVTGGELERDRSIADYHGAPYDNEWTVKKPGLYTLWMVAHDVRGGVSWESFQIQILDV